MRAQTAPSVFSAPAAIVARGAAGRGYRALEPARRRSRLGHCGTRECRVSPLEVSGLGALAAVPSDEEIAEVIFPRAQVKNVPGFNEAARQGILNTLARGALPYYTGEYCEPSSGVDTGAIITQTATGTALKLAPAAGPFAPVVAIGAAFAGLFTALFGAHKQAVKKEQRTLCVAMPAANEAIAYIEGELRAGRITKDQAIGGLDNVQTEFRRAVAEIIKDDGKKCNAACVYYRYLRALVMKKKAEFAEMPEPSPPTQLVPGLDLPPGIKKFLPLAAVAAAVLLLGKGL